ncbi:MAG TPA: SDR family NAD(P)-dependent oxidoreductase [Dehalococcoidia bacterium]|nr:SDR family NAD(P)-dependent oxidoreductase [Dehalococcoidia bacterium]
MDSLKGKVAVVTGGGSGVGQALAGALANEGMRIVVGDADIKAAEAAVADITQLGARAIASRVDIADRASVGALADLAFDEFGTVHVLCNCAREMVARPAAEMEDADWGRVISVNLDGTINVLTAFLPRLVAQGEEGHILSVSASTGLFAQQNAVANATADHAAMGLLAHLNTELQPLRIGVSVLCLSTAAGQDFEFVARLALRGIKDNQLYVFSEPSTRPQVEARLAEIRAAYSSLIRSDTR